MNFNNLNSPIFKLLWTQARRMYVWTFHSSQSNCLNKSPTIVIASPYKKLYFGAKNETFNSDGSVCYGMGRKFSFFRECLELFCGTDLCNYTRCKKITPLTILESRFGIMKKKEKVKGTEKDLNFARRRHNKKCSIEAFFCAKNLKLLR